MFVFIQIKKIKDATENFKNQQQFPSYTFVSETPRDIFPGNTGHLHQHFSGKKIGIEIPFRSGFEIL